MKVGCIGLGQMGSGMAESLLRAGHEVTVHNRTREKAVALVAKGAILAASVVDACRGDAVLTMLANDEAVEAVVYGEKGVLASLAKGAVHVSDQPKIVGAPRGRPLGGRSASRGSAGVRPSQRRYRGQVVRCRRG